jgi:hypothetical protein
MDKKKFTNQDRVDMLAFMQNRPDMIKNPKLKKLALAKQKKDKKLEKRIDDIEDELF